ncbi:MAG: BamA/TamA family outer membrane protein [Sphingomonadales bacterium]|nr:BamA/TamA family outer membrane protein [Sphingomonadales bacterium]
MASLIGASPGAAQTSPVQPAAAQPAAVQSAPGAGLPAMDPIIPDGEFDAAIPKVTPADDPDLAKPLESIADFERRVAARQAGAATQKDAPSTPNASPGSPVMADKPGADAIGSAPIGDAELAKPLPPLDSFEIRPTTFAEPTDDTRVVELAYGIRLDGLAEADVQSGGGLADAFAASSALRRGKGRAANLAQLTSRVSEDSLLLGKLLAAQGWFDARITTRIDRSATADGQPLTAVLDVVPGKRFTYATIAIDAAPTVPPSLIRDNLALRTGAPVVAAQVLGAEARVALALPENGYPFAELGQRDILLDPDSGGADYRLPVTVGPRGTFGTIVSEGQRTFDAAHIAVLGRFSPGQPYDSHQVDDLRQALIATGLFSAVAVEPRHSGAIGPDGIEAVTIAVRQEAGPPRVIAATAGYGTGEGFQVQGSWTNRNLFPPEGALIVSGLAGTLKQGGGVTFRRADAGRRDRTFELAAELDHAQYDAFSAYTGRLAARVSYDSTPLWQKRLTYAYGAQLIGSDESVYVPALAQRTRRTYAIAGLTGQIGFDTTDSLLDPAKGFRVVALVEPEGSIHGSFAPYARLRLDGSTYYKIGGDLILAARVRLATIEGVALDDLAPSRRLYAGGGGSVRGFGYQQLGPRDPNGDPTGARSLNEAAFEARYRFGDYGVVAFIDAGQAYQDAVPRFTDLRAGVGLGARIYTNFGPMRIDLATPLARRPGESRINVYVSIGQAF